ncbi:protein translocase subunit secY/sec61 alpha [Kytococcus aerolatus]|uniref:Protein translocase subunit SecY n=1 Tax=Kytococcus aerolatus TaxID=592308 RepID=A0A212TA72_9MICO|nr:preprotein translocase subunit SecY [Kytococcus aerolatus]SNC62716.1 protein translocase subunit secY/sec61 alpha [Kytococcus aerolatus]
MLSSFGRAFRTPELRGKLLFTLAIMALFRLGSHVPTPGINYQLVQQCREMGSGSNSLLGLTNMFSGGAMLQLSIFALGIMPYITASIIVQLLTVVIPHFERLKQEGSSGQAKMTQYTRYLTIGLAVLQSSTLITFARNPWQLFGGAPEACPTIMTDDSLWTVSLMVLTLTAGTGLVMWLGEQITEHGVGNGMSLLIFTAIAAGFPGSLWAIKDRGWDKFVLVLLLGLAILTIVVFVEQCQRRIPVQYAKRMVGRRMYGGTSTYIPLKLNMANVIPIIFASSILMLPMMAAQFRTPDDGTRPAAWIEWVSRHLTMGTDPVYVLVYFVLIVFFAFFYTSITFDPDDVADSMKRYGGFVPGVRAGKPTAHYLRYVLNRITTPGALYLGVLALIPLYALDALGSIGDFPFGGASLLIVVGVGLQTVKQIESKLQQHEYEGFLR